MTQERAAIPEDMLNELGKLTLDQWETVEGIKTKKLEEQLVALEDQKQALTEKITAIKVKLGKGPSSKGGVKRKGKSQDKKSADRMTKAQKAELESALLEYAKRINLPFTADGAAKIEGFKSLNKNQTRNILESLVKAGSLKKTAGKVGRTKDGKTQPATYQAI